ncbi:hypothetical protein, partial [Pseudomonas sp. AP19]|uniref:hypothetical protein n=1 Tax=Pseudomonas sp. AP19 TaxID=1535623 RepID=UPI001C45CAA9
DGGGRGILVGHKISVGAGLPAMAVGQVSLSAAGTVLTELGVTDQAALSVLLILGSCLPLVSQTCS